MSDKRSFSDRRPAGASRRIFGGRRPKPLIRAN